MRFDCIHCRKATTKPQSVKGAFLRMLTIFQTDCKFSLANRLSDSIGVVAPTGQQPEEVTLRAYGPFADYLRKHPFHHSQVERNDMGTFTSFDYMLLVTDELVDEILALGDKVEIAYPEKLRMKLLQKIGRIRNRYMVI